jgi:hypothetical protein
MLPQQRKEDKRKEDYHTEPLSLHHTWQIRKHMDKTKAPERL